MKEYYGAQLFWEGILHSVINDTVTIDDPQHVSFRIYCHAHILPKH